ncbi:MAG TPA: MraY family glycosyltransferase [Ktedonobacteraceae bacterium]|nr:MraY family glycosyltransferase [Ktedonobacteraceae bacterium]
MIESMLMHMHLLLLDPIQIPSLAFLLIGGACAFVLAYVLTFAVRSFCHRVGWLDLPAARRVHTNPLPRLGGVAIFLAFVVVSLLFYTLGPKSNSNEIVIYWLLLVSGGLIVLVHMYDDVKGLNPLPKLIVQTIAVIIILGPWGTVFHGILLFTFNNPFGTEIMQPGLPWYREPTLFLFIHQSGLSLAAIPSILLTWFWIVGMMNTVNWIDGIDGLATGVVAIAALFITIISWIMGQQSIAILSAIFTGATLGFLPHNWNPAKIFMGDSGSMFLGLGLAVLSVMGGAKLALTLMVLGCPVLDVAVVVMSRIRRGQSPLKYDKTHLHHRLLANGASVRQICYMFYSLAFVFGILAISLSGLKLAHFYKLVGLGLVTLTITLLIIWIDYQKRRSRTHVELGDAKPTIKL